MFEALPKAWDDILSGMTREELDGYIITMHSNISKSSGEIGDSVELIKAMVSGKRASYVSERLRQLKSAKLSDLNGYNGMFEDLASCRNAVTTGAENIINENSGYYAQIIHPFR